MNTIDHLAKKSRRSISTVIETGYIQKPKDEEEGRRDIYLIVETVYDPTTKKLRSFVFDAPLDAAGEPDPLPNPGSDEPGIVLNAEPLEKFTVKEAKAEHQWIVENLDLLIIGSGHEEREDVEAMRDLLAGARVLTSPRVPGKLGPSATSRIVLVTGAS